MLVFRKTLNLRLGVFFACCFCVVSLGAEQFTTACRADINLLTLARLDAVVDGDTLRLVGGDKLRLIGVNTPELSSVNPGKKRIAYQAKELVQAFFMGQVDIYIQAGIDKNDRYGRRLVHLYRRDGRSLTAALLSQGLGWQVVVPRNTGMAACYRAIELQAERQQQGVWGRGVAMLDAEQIQPHNAGFNVIEGTVSKVDRVKAGWWLEMGRLAIFIKNEDVIHFKNSDFKSLLHKQFRLKAWIIDRSGSKAVIKSSYLPYTAHWRHPLMGVSR